MKLNRNLAVLLSVFILLSANAPHPAFAQSKSVTKKPEIVREIPLPKKTSPSLPSSAPSAPSASSPSNRSSWTGLIAGATILGGSYYLYYQNSRKAQNGCETTNALGVCTLYKRSGTQEALAMTGFAVGSLAMGYGIWKLVFSVRPDKSAHAEVALSFH